MEKAGLGRGATGRARQMNGGKEGSSKNSENGSKEEKAGLERVGKGRKINKRVTGRVE